MTLLTLTIYAAGHTGSDVQAGRHRLSVNSTSSHHRCRRLPAGAAAAGDDGGPASLMRLVPEAGGRLTSEQIDSENLITPC